MESGTNFAIANPHVFKCVILGDAGVGKTSILHHFIFNKCISNLLKNRQKGIKAYSRSRI
jgi:hypothetical protein